MAINEACSVVSEGVVALVLDVEINNAEDTAGREKRCKRIND
jgi:hypothetical protein